MDKSMMEEPRRTELTEKSNTLRLELKAWEKGFAAAHDGKKASREDIKQNPDIAIKYKEYNKVRDILTGKAVESVLPPPKHQTPKKRKREDNNGGREALKRQQIDKTPSKSQMYPWEVDPYDSPSAIRNLFSPSTKALGPTPQRDGHVLGLFDLLEEVAESPSNPNGKTIHGTPGKSRVAGTPHKHSRTPGGRKRLFDAFATPLKNKDTNGQGGWAPTSVSKSDLTTPSFLRRIKVLPDGVWKSPELARGPKKPVMRSLSSMLASLRQMQDDAADDDLDALHEMENMGEVGRDIPKSKTTKSRPVPETIPEEPPKDILIEDSQPGFPLGGFDDEAQFDSDPEAPELGRDGKPLKAYKKKGQKRTTRRVKLKPNRSKPTVEPKSHAVDDEGSEDELAGDDSAVPETQINPETGFAATRNYDSESQSEYTASEGGTRYRRADQTKNRNLNKDGKIKTAARKVGALAHTNFKRLKLRNSGAKGGAAHNSRFRRKK